MEPVSFAVGLIGLAGLLNTCLELVDKIDSWKDFGNETRSLAAQFETHKIRLERWGQAVGLEQGHLSSNHNKLLDDPRTLSNIQTLLLAIKDICSNDSEDRFSQRSILQDEKRFGKIQMFGKNAHSKDSPESKRQKLSWALRKKAKRITQVTQLSTLVDDLHSLVPTDAEKDAGANEGKDNHVLWLGEFKIVMERIEKEIEKETIRELRTWLLGGHSANDLYELYVERSVEGSCEWILDRPWFTNWSSPEFSSGRTKLLWINGPAGFGKSILCAKIVEHLSAMDMPIAHFFFSSSFESRGDPLIAIRSWLSQLISHSGVFESIRDIWETTRGERATRGEVVKLLQEAVSTNPGCTLILDGLDECDCVSEAHSVVNTSDSITRFLETLRQVTTGTSTRILIVSRDEPQIRHCLLPNYRAQDPIQEYRITPGDNEKDILSYSRSIVSERLPKKTAAAREEIAQRLASRCNGQFLWIKLQQNTLRSGKSQKRLEEAIDATPTGLETLYERNWTKISQLPEEDRSRAFSLLRWAAFSLRPLTVSEISAAVLIQDDCDELLLDDLPDSIDEDYIDTEILGICGSLLEIRGPEGDHDARMRTVNLAHFSVKEYLLHNIPTQTNTLFTISTEDAESTRLAKKCLRYVNCQEIWHGTSDAQKDQVLSSFRDYAADSWYQHATSSGINDPELLNLINRLFDVDNPSWFQWKRWFDSKKMDPESPDTTPRIETTGPLFYAVWLGFENLVKLLLNQARFDDINDKSYEGQSSLFAACEKGDLEIVRLLLAQAADVMVPDDYGSMPLNRASSNGHVEVVRLLLESGADIASQNRWGWTPLNAASYKGHLEVVGLLIENGADITIPSNDGWTPLNSASFNGHTGIVKLLLEKRADFKIPNSGEWTPASTACQQGHIEVINLLLEYGANLTTAAHDGTTPLCLAASRGHHEMVKLILEKGIDVAVPDKIGQAALHYAAENGHAEVARLLLDKGADLTIPSESGITPLHFASYGGHTEVTRLFLERGAELAAKDKVGITPLHYASVNGHVEVIKLLLEEGVERELATKHLDMLSPLTPYDGHDGPPRYPSNNAEFRDRYGRTPLFYAAGQGHIEVVDILISDDASVDATDCYLWTPLFLAVMNEQEEVVKLLIAFSTIDASHKDGLGRTLSWWAAKSETHGIIKMVHQWAKEPYDDIVEALPTKERATAESDQFRPCDACMRNMKSNSATYTCDHCGYLDICQGCFNLGIRCLDSSHELTFNQPLG